MSGTSDSAKRRLQLKERDPQKYAEMLQKHNERYKETKRKREEYWASGTRQALVDKEAYYAKRRGINRKSFQKQQSNQSSTRTTRASIEATPTTDRVNRKIMSPEERREHDSIKRKERKERKSRQKQTADRIAHAKYMRAWRQNKKVVTNEQIPGPSLKSSTLPLPVPQDVPIAQETPLAVPHVPATSTSPLPMQPCTSTPKLKRNKGRTNLQEQTRMRQHCYNTASKRFYRNTAVSRVLPHKRYATKWGPGYVMVMSLKNAHQAYQTHYGRKVGFSTFASLRPRNVRKLGSVPVDTCLCVTCTNINDLLEQLVGDLQNPTRGTTFVQHLFTAYWQQSQYDLAKDSLQQGQIMLVQDFAENRKATYSEEVKSAHFGKAQISLHPTVAFYVNSDGEQVRHVAMFFSDDIGHDYHAVHCYTQKMVEMLQNETPVREVIIWSDGAASQYKGRGSFADLSLYPFPVQRNFFGSEHGKGEADGETGRFSQAMARAVAKGHSFKDAKDMVDFGAATYSSEPLRKYSFVLVKKEEIVRERPETDVSTLPGTRSFHQVLRRKNYVVSARQLSCFCTGCKEEKFECCINTSFVQQFETFKIKPSSEIPQVGEWLEIIGTIQTKKSQLDKTYFAKVVSPPEDGSGDFFYCQFFKETSSGSYTANPRLYQIVPGTKKNYRWRRIPAPHTNARGHFFFN
ncbi:(S)-beta-bisabolene synthase [Plakobranchus ocellatus]|uniref:(S)-beta-bisabolene synthase n=1 Tax=Plakobranchus ocellatus TaxID=259542 RepID=A0AAV4C967_9GAST|nr:(S)-beta-bisabolene synthase [Plakobranchus ocellatus]